MRHRNGKGVAVGDALVNSSPLVPRWLKISGISLLLVGLFFSRPTVKQFYNTVWIQALAGIKAERFEQQGQRPLGRFLLNAAKLTALGPLVQFLEQAKESDLDALPAFWMEHTEFYDWTLATYFLYRESDCFSDYLGIAGRLFNLQDGCDVERYRAKGGAST